MPAYLCESMVEAIPESSINYYAITSSLTAKDTSWIKNVSKGDMVLIIDYFGFDLFRETMAAVKKKGAWTVQDAAHSLLSTFDRTYADFVLYSPRKLLGVPDGGILQTRCSKDLSSIKLSPAPADLAMKSIKAFINRTLFDQGGNTIWFEDYQESERANHAGYYRMSDITSNLLSSAINYEGPARQRRLNYERLADALSDVALFKSLPSDVVPLGFPVLLDNRNQVRESLYEKNIFCPIHWEIGDFVSDAFPTSHMISNQILTLLCDQRLSEDLLATMIKTVKGLQ